MHQKPISPDDPRLTAYALNEMTPEERVEFEEALSTDLEAQRIVEEIRTTGGLLATALEREPAPAAETPLNRAAIVPGRIGPVLDGGGTLAEQAQRKKGILNQPIRFPQFYYMVSGLAAACFALFFLVWQRNQPVREKRYYQEVDLTALDQRENERERRAEVSAERKAVEAASVERAIQAAQAARTSQSTAADLGYVAVATVAGSRQQAEMPAGAGSGSQFQFDSDRAHAQPSSLAPAPAARAAGVQLSMRRLHPPVLDRVDEAFSTEAYAFRKDHDYVRVTDQPLSTFSVDVDTASYANVRRFLTQGQRPPADAVRIEELINYFSYQYPEPVDGTPFAASLEVASAPWAPEHRLVRIGLKGREISDAGRPVANLVFLIDVSGSMRSANKLPLVKQSLRLLVDKLRPEDRVAIAVYAGASGLALPSTPVSRKAEILEAVDRLDAGGSTNGAMGIHLAYDVAKANFVTGGVNRVILATDGDFNVGTTSEGELVRLIGEKARSGVFLSVLGFGMGNLKDGTLEQIADKGNGRYAYIDSLAEARKALVEQAGGTLVTIAKDVKIQVEFNPAQVAAYRLIGYENRLLAKEDFNNDQVDAGEIGAGHTVTALYEIVPAGAALPAETPAVDALKYQRVAGAGATATLPSKARGEVAATPDVSGEMLTVKIRYKEPAGEESRKLEFALRDAGRRFEEASQDFKFAAAVAAFGMALRDSPHRGQLTLAEVAAWGRAGIGRDAGGYRSEFLGLVEKARALQ